MLSHVAGIIDRNDGLRVVVTEKISDFSRHHRNLGDRIFVVPGYKVQEPVPWEEIPQVVETVQKYVTKLMTPKNHCGECMECCFHMYVKDESGWTKPSKRWCENTSKGFGCKIYALAPKICRTWKCLWRQSQERNDRMAADLRPDKCGAIFTAGDSEHGASGDPLIVEVHGEPNERAWEWINEIQRLGWKAKKITHYIGEKK